MQQGRKRKMIEIKPKFFVIILILIAALILGLAWFFDFHILDVSEVQYETINITRVETLYDTNDYMLVVDTSISESKYFNGYLPRAIWCSDPEVLYDNPSSTILVYGDNSKTFCESLSRHYNGMLFCFEGGYEEWSTRNQ